MCYTVFLETNRGAKYMKLTHKHTLAASYLGYITQAVVNNLTPLLFVVFETSLGISIALIKEFGEGGLRAIEESVRLVPYEARERLVVEEAMLRT